MTDCLASTLSLWSLRRSWRTWLYLCSSSFWICLCELLALDSCKVLRMFVAFECSLPAGCSEGCSCGGRLTGETLATRLALSRSGVGLSLSANVLNSWTFQWGWDRRAWPTHHSDCSASNRLPSQWFCNVCQYLLGTRSTCPGAFHFSPLSLAVWHGYLYWVISPP